MTLPIPERATLAQIDALRQQPRGRRIGVLGLGVVGGAMARFLATRGARVVAADRRTDLDQTAWLEQGVEVRLGAMDAETFADVEALAISPGADPRQPAVRACIDRGIPVFGELELAGRLPAKVLAITGTNGKSTTTSLAGELVRATGVRAFVGGNLGEPIIAWLDRGEAADVAVVELSSFQLETAWRFAADVAVVLNVTPDHGDRYDTLEHYAATKQRLVAGLGETGVAVLNRDDPRVAAMAAATHSPVRWFSTRTDSEFADGVRLTGDRAVFAGEAAGLGEVALDHPRLFGVHNRQNAMAAMLAVHALDIGASRVPLERAYRSFSGLEHRLEWVGEVAGVRYVNDSKATNDESAAVALRAMDQPVILLLGGRDKGGGYQQVATEAAQRARRVIAFGEARPMIVDDLRGHPGLLEVETFAAAVRLSVEEARPGETVLLSPACSSFDEFANYQVRGRAFKALVADLTDASAEDLT